MLWELRRLNKLAENSGRPTTPFQCLKCGQFIRLDTLSLKTFSPLCHLTAEQFPGLLSNPEAWATPFLLPGFTCQENAQSSRVLWKEPLSTSLIKAQPVMMTNEDNKVPGQAAMLFGVSRPSWKSLKQCAPNSALALLWTGACTRLAPVIPSNLNDWICHECGNYWSKGKLQRTDRSWDTYGRIFSFVPNTEIILRSGIQLQLLHTQTI